MPLTRASLRRLLGLVFLQSLASLASAAEVDVYLLGGQSNMQGIGKLAELPADVPRDPADTFF